MLIELLKLANKLDEKGLYEEANLLDKLAQQVINIPENAVKPIVGNPFSSRMKSKPGPAPKSVRIDPLQTKTPPQVQLPEKQYKPIPLADDMEQNIEDWELELMNMEISPEAREKEQAYKKHEKPTDPKELEEMYRQVGEEEWHDRSGPISSETAEKVWPGSQPKNTRDLPYGYKPKAVDVSDWLEQKERGSERPLDVEEEHLSGLERKQFEDLD